ncbi:DgyrCDS2585 [Dimorphilus gyrociliatus]|uniref:Transporter n=1 Tax=Dimorphilus gyrociliatus TaxID=2664684 RepID=A0A7I8VDT0_9ANNE|nr:DgyrCDS2585 [Dimorphilus gyrociliatus]
MEETRSSPQSDEKEVGLLLKRSSDVEEELDGRETWGKKVDFLLSIIGFAVDLANVWRFPYLCYKNGGGAFLIPYFLMLIFGAVPLFFMELILGQFHRQGPVSVWKIVPLLKGIGLAECLIAYLVAFYYNVVIAWSFFYLVSSFTSSLPWTTCGNIWNTDNCSDLYSNLTNATSPAKEFFEMRVLGLKNSTGIHDIGSPRWELVLCLMLVFACLYFSLWKGVKSSGKVVWVTATMPYVVLSILLVRGLLLPGSTDGILYFLTPKIHRLADSQVWIDAAVQIFYSVGAGFGVHLAYASYNKFNNNCYRDCLFTACINSFTSIFSGIVIFCYLGYMSNKQNKNIEQVAVDGPGLVFEVYPEAIATLPGSIGWSIVFFFMLITLGMDSAMGGLESVITGVIDQNRNFLKSFRYRRELITFITILGAFAFALPSVTNGGMYVFNIFDKFAAGTSILFAVFSEAVAVSWFYGLDQFCTDVEKMLGFRPSLYWRICWKFISPAFVLTIVVSSLIKQEPLIYDASWGRYHYPELGYAIGWSLSAASMILIPGYAIYHIFFKQKGTIKQRFLLSISPTWEQSSIIRSQRAKRTQTRHWFSLGRHSTESEAVRLSERNNLNCNL